MQTVALTFASEIIFIDSVSMPSVIYSRQLHRDPLAARLLHEPYASPQ